jgi:hypothetical protein
MVLHEKKRQKGQRDVDEAPNAAASVGKPTLAMLAPSEASNMGSERLPSTHRTDAVGFPARALYIPAMMGVTTIFRTPQHDA